MIVDRKSATGGAGGQGNGNLHDQRSGRFVGHRGDQRARHRRGESGIRTQLSAVLAYPDETFRGKVVRIGNRVEAQSRTLEVRIEVG